jgi:hypothetical protein
MDNYQSSPVWIVEKGKKVLYVDYRLLSQNQMVEQFQKAINLAREEGGDLLLLANFEKAPVSKAVIDEIKVLAAEDLKKRDVKSAVLGITGIKRFLITIYSQFSNDSPAMFTSYQEAIDYLVED